MNELPSETKTRSISSPIVEVPEMFLLLQIAQVIERRLEEALDKEALSGPKFIALTKLVQAGESLPLSELASRLTCVRSNITQLVDRLEAEGLAHREEDPNDRRSVRASVTPLGRERQAAGERRVEEVREALSKALSQLDRGVLERTLEALK